MKLDSARFDFWTADGWLWTHDGRPVPCEDAWAWYAENPVDETELGGEA